MRNLFRLFIFALLMLLLLSTALAETSGAEAQRQLEQISSLRAFNLIAFFAYLVAALICTAFSVWMLKGKLIKQSLSRSDLIELFFFLFCCLWFYILFILSAKGNIPYTGKMRDFGVLELLMFLCMAFWPAVVYHLALQNSEKIGLHKFHRALLIYFDLSGIVLAGSFFYAFIAYRLQRFGLCNSLLHWGSMLFEGNFIVCAILILFKSMRTTKEMKCAREEPEVKSSRQWTIFIWALWLFALWPPMLVAMFGVISIREYGKYINLLATLMPLPFIIVDMYYQARYLFVDIFIKKSDVVIVTGLITVFYYVFVVEKFSQSGVWKNMKYPALLILLPLIIAIPFLAGGVERLVDKYLFKRKFTPSEALSNFSRAIRFISGEQRLLEISKSYLTDIFSTKNVMVFFSEEPDRAFSWVPKLEEFTKAKRPILLNEIQYPETVDFCKRNAIEVIVPLVLEEKMKGCLALGKRNYKEPYLSEDLNLLNSIADQLGSALENIRLERKRREQKLKEQELKILAGKAELRALRAQINPHFLFNTLNTIASLIRLDPNKAEETVEMLSDVFRYTLAKSRVDFVPLIEEVNFIKAYLEVEKARFGDKLQIGISIDPQVQETKVPSMVLQPLVENAIKHGIAPKVGGGKLEISATRENGFLSLVIKDDGMGFDASKSQRLNNDGVGFKNVRDRISAIYGSEECLQIHSKPNDGTTVLIKIPI